ncbi:hypothetical protein FHS72_001292 [Loktanella ponticola]|uniref:DUF192 domain-containing protein n=1 Tax=Yoonia ponticola TaxID=1524255 RepID=A0A7W9BJK3_9RHOB|nr:hypothetical protein [Yoonia ponticola]
MIKPIAAALLLMMSGTGAIAATCTDDVARVVGDFGQANFKVDIADDDAERAQGLMFVESMPTLGGMLFVYEGPRRATFWMRNTLIPLDMLFAAPDGTVLRIHENAIPGDETTIDGGDGVLAVLEINGGLSARLGITAGAVIQHPSFGADAVLPCTN